MYFKSVYIFMILSFASIRVHVRAINSALGEDVPGGSGFVSMTFDCLTIAYFTHF